MPTLMQRREGRLATIVKARTKREARAAERFAKEHAAYEAKP